MTKRELKREIKLLVKNGRMDEARKLFNENKYRLKYRSLETYLGVASRAATNKSMQKVQRADIAPTSTNTTEVPSQTNNKEENMEDKNLEEFSKKLNETIQSAIQGLGGEISKVVKPIEQMLNDSAQTIKTIKEKVIDEPERERQRRAQEESLRQQIAEEERAAARAEAERLIKEREENLRKKIVDFCSLNPDDPHCKTIDDALKFFEGEIRKRSLDPSSITAESLRELVSKHPAGPRLRGDGIRIGMTSPKAQDSMVRIMREMTEGNPEKVAAFYKSLCSDDVCRAQVQKALEEVTKQKPTEQPSEQKEPQEQPKETERDKKTFFKPKPEK